MARCTTNILTSARCPTAERETWKRKWRGFVQRVALANNRRIVLKSPTHTARVRTILEVFPNARFIHIVRDPLVLFPSTVRLWKSLSEVQGFQIPRDDGGWMETSVLDNFVRMYECFEQDRELIPPGRLVDIRYEDLVADPVGEMRQIYQRLNLGDFAEVEPALTAACDEDRATTRPNKYSLPPEVAERVRGRWAPYFQRYGYNGHEATVPRREIWLPRLAWGTTRLNCDMFFRRRHNLRMAAFSLACGGRRLAQCVMAHQSRSCSRGASLIELLVVLFIISHHDGAAASRRCRQRAA